MNIEVLKTAKERLGISYDEIARRSGVPKATVTNVMCGYTKRPRIDTIHSIAAALGIENLFIEEEIGTKKESLTADELEMLSLFKEIGNKLGLEGQTTLKNIAKSLLEMKKA